MRESSQRGSVEVLVKYFVEAPLPLGGRGWAQLICDVRYITRGSLEVRRKVPRRSPTRGAQVSCNVRCVMRTLKGYI